MLFLTPQPGLPQAHTEHTYVEFLKPLFMSRTEVKAVYYEWNDTGHSLAHFQAAPYRTKDSSVTENLTIGR